MSDAQNAWIKRILGYEPGQGGAGATGQKKARFPDARAAWRDAIETVDGQISALAGALRASGDEELAEIGEFGMNALTGNHKVKLMAALMELGAGTPDAIAKNGPKALALVRAFRQHVETDERIAVCDDNPAGVPMSIRATLVPALDGLETALAA